MTTEHAQRQTWMSDLAQSDGAALAARWADFSPKPAYDFLRKPEIGLVMTRGAAGGGGAAFNLGEATAVRCAVRLASGETGFGYVLGRDRRHAEIMAVCDALMQTPAAGAVEQAILAPLRAARAEARAVRARKAAATKAQFLTMTRGEDPQS